MHVSKSLYEVDRVDDTEDVFLYYLNCIDAENMLEFLFKHKNGIPSFLPPAFKYIKKCMTITK